MKIVYEHYSDKISETIFVEYRIKFSNLHFQNLETGKMS